MPERLIPLSEFLGAEGRLERDDAVLCIVPASRVIARRLAAWMWPSGLLTLAGVAALLSRAAARDQFAFTGFVLICAACALPVVAVAYPRTRPTAGLQRLCWITVSSKSRTAAGLFGGGDRESKLVCLVALPGSRGLALVGTNVVGLREGGLSLMIECSSRGRVARVKLEQDSTGQWLAAFGRLPKALE